MTRRLRKKKHKAEFACYGFGVRGLGLAGQADLLLCWVEDHGYTVGGLLGEKFEVVFECKSRLKPVEEDKVRILQALRTFGAHSLQVSEDFDVFYALPAKWHELDERSDGGDSRDLRLDSGPAGRGHGSLPAAGVSLDEGGAAGEPGEAAEAAAVVGERKT